MKRERPPAGERSNRSRRAIPRSKAGEILYKTKWVPSPQVFKRAPEIGAQFKNEGPKQLCKGFTREMNAGERVLVP